MFNVLGDINWLAALAALAATVVLGGLWFTVLFGRSYARSLGRADPGELDNSAPIFIVGPAVCSLLVTVTSAVLIAALGVQSTGDALAFGLIVGVGYLAANTVNIAINPNMPRPLHYGAISGSYNVVACVIASLLLVSIG